MKFEEIYEISKKESSVNDCQQNYSIIKKTQKQKSIDFQECVAKKKTLRKNNRK